ncbi:MAG TPA: alpha/beta hydrolase family protein [Candidatus Saccharimonadales bacterium]|nr:alpha/beta hydrolase family protein [Candidatus Saccharimonadales bacterium]
MKAAGRWITLLGFLLVVVSASLAQPSAVGRSRVECSTLNSRILVREVPYCVMLPPSYAQDVARHYPVSYYLHGLGDNEQSLVNLGGWSIYDRLMREKKIGEFVVAAPAGFASFYINSKDGKFRYEDFFMHEFLPAMEKKYRIGTTRSQRGIMGVSMGGFGALHYGFKYPEKFAAVSANMPALIERLPRELPQEQQQRLMSALFGNPPDTSFYEKNSAFYLERTAPLPALKRITIYFDCGEHDRFGFNLGAAAMDKLLTQRGIPHEAHIYPGGHDWPFVLEHLAASLEAQSKGLRAN